MRSVLRVFVFVVVLQFCATALRAGGGYVIGTGHLHSIKWSDGLKPPSVIIQYATTLGYDYIIISDHREKKLNNIEMTASGPVNRNFEQYCKDFASTKNLVVIIGVEMTYDNGHLVVYGERARMRRYCATPRPATLQGAVDLANACGLLSIAAHPSNHHFPFLRTVRGYNFVGFGNESKEEYFQTRKLYFTLLGEGLNVCPFFDNDSHTALDVTQWDVDRWNRATIVYAAKTEASILAAMRAGKVEITKLGLFTYRWLTPIPSFTWYPFAWRREGKPLLEIEGRYTLPTTRPHKEVLWQNGEHKSSSEANSQVMRPMQYGIGMSYEGYDAPSGRNWYVLEVEHEFMSGPMRRISR